MKNFDLSSAARISSSLLNIGTYRGQRWEGQSHSLFLWSHTKIRGQTVFLGGGGGLTQSRMLLTVNTGLAIDTIVGVHTFTEGFSEMKVRSARLTSVLSLVVLKSFRALPAVVCGEERGKEDELEGGGWWCYGLPTPSQGTHSAHTPTPTQEVPEMSVNNNEII